MTRTVQPPPASDGIDLQQPAGGPDAAGQELARILSAKLAQGYTIESQSKAAAVLVSPGRKRWWGLLGNDAGTRERITVDAQGRAMTRKVGLAPGH